MNRRSFLRLFSSAAVGAAVVASCGPVTAAPAIVPIACEYSKTAMAMASNAMLRRMVFEFQCKRGGRHMAMRHMAGLVDMFAEHWDEVTALRRKYNLSTHWGFWLDETPELFA